MIVRYAFRDYTAWNRTINYYRATTLQATEQFFKENQSKFRIKVPTLQIFGEADRAIAPSTARASAAWVQVPTATVVVPEVGCLGPPTGAAAGSFSLGAGTGTRQGQLPHQELHREHSILVLIRISLRVFEKLF